jgi:hypothetical protein
MTAATNIPTPASSHIAGWHQNNMGKTLMKKKQTSKTKRATATARGIITAKKILTLNTAEWLYQQTHPKPSTHKE